MVTPSRKQKRQDFLAAALEKVEKLRQQEIDLTKEGESGDDSDNQAATYKKEKEQKDGDDERDHAHISEHDVKGLHKRKRSDLSSEEKEKREESSSESEEAPQQVRRKPSNLNAGRKEKEKREKKKARKDSEDSEEEEEDERGEKKN